MIVKSFKSNKPNLRHSVLKYFLLSVRIVFVMYLFAIMEYEFIITSPLQDREYTVLEKSHENFIGLFSMLHCLIIKSFSIALCNAIIS